MLQAGCQQCEVGAHTSQIERVAYGPYWVHGKLSPSPVPGWMVIAPQRHVEQLDALTDNEVVRLAQILRLLTQILRTVTGCEKVYTAVFAEVLPHLHVHVIAREKNWAPEFRGARIFEAPPLTDTHLFERTTQEVLHHLRRSIEAEK